MTALLPPLPAFMAAWLRRPRKTEQPQAAPQALLQERALERMLPMMLANAPHPYQASLLLYLMDEQRQQQRRPRD